MTEGRANRPVARDGSAQFWTPVLSCYAATFVLSTITVIATRGTEADPARVAVPVLSLAGLFAVAAGAWIVASASHWNAWVLFSVGFPQAAVFALPATVVNTQAIVETFSIVPSVVTGLLFALGGCLVGAVRRTLPAGALSPGIWWRWMTAIGGGPYSKVDQSLKVVATLTQLYTLAKALLSLVR